MSNIIDNNSILISITIVNSFIAGYYFIEVSYMSRIFSLILVFSILFSFSLVSQSNDIKGIINTEISLSQLSRLSPEEMDRIIEEDRYLIINGTVSSIMEIERSDTNLILDLHLVNGKWIGLDRVEEYRCIVNISGKEWEPLFPRRTPREPADNMILLNNRILVLGKLSSYVVEKGELIAVVDAEYVRNIQ